MAGTGFLGQYLLEHGYITRDQLLQAMALVQSRNQKFGDIAVALGMINIKVRDQVIERQDSDGRAFGEVAADMGVMRNDEIDKVLRAQKLKNIAIGDALVELGHISRDLLAIATRSFDAFYRSAADLDLSAIADSELRDFVRWTIKLLDTIGGIKARVSDCVLDPNPIHAAMHAHTFGWSEFHLLVNRGLASRIAAEWTGGWVETHELLDDAVREFLNTIVGKTFSSSPVGRRIKFDPPYTSPLTVPEDLKLVHLATTAGNAIIGHGKGRRSPTPEQIKEAEGVIAATEPQPRRVALIVDDSRLIRRMLHDILAELGFSPILEAASAQEAASLAAKERPALVTLDITLPDASGLEALKTILAASPQSHVLMVSSTDREVEVTEALQNGASGYFTKPIDLRRLQDTLAKLYLV